MADIQNYDTPDELDKASEMLDGWLKTKDEEAKQLANLEEQISLFPEKVLSGSIQPLTDAYQKYHLTMLKRRGLFIELNQMLRNPCAGLVNAYFDIVVMFATTLNTDFPSYLKVIMTEQGELGDVQYRRVLLKNLLVQINAYQTTLWIQLHGAYTDPSQGPFPLPSNQNQTPIAGFEGCQDVELIQLINQFNGFLATATYINMDVFKLLGEAFDAIGNFLSSWVHQGGIVATFDGFLEGIGIWTLSDLALNGINIAFGGLPFAIINALTEQHFKSGHDIRGYAADVFWEAVQILDGDDIRNNPVWQTSHNVGHAIGLTIGIFNALVDVINFINFAKTINIGFDIIPPAQLALANNVGSLSYGFSTVAIKANAVNWAQGAALLKDVVAGVLMFASGQGGGGSNQPQQGQQRYTFTEGNAGRRVTTANTSNGTIRVEVNTEHGYRVHTKGNSVKSVPGTGLTPDEIETSIINDAIGANRSNIPILKNGQFYNSNGNIIFSQVRNNITIQGHNFYYVAHFYPNGDLYISNYVLI